MKNCIDRFEQYWKECQSSISYRLFMSSERSAVHDLKKVNRTVNEEIWIKRFGNNQSLRHGAAAFMADIKKEAPDIGHQVESRLCSFKVSAGINMPLCLCSAAAAIFFLILLVVFLITVNPILCILSGILFLASAVTAATQLARNGQTRRRLQADMNKERDGIVKLLQTVEE